MNENRVRLHYGALSQPGVGEFSLTAIGDCIWSQKFDRSLSEPFFDVMSQSDIAFANFEQALTESERKGLIDEPLSLATPKILPEFTEAGIKIVSLANNHFMDNSEAGLRLGTLALKKAKIQYTGAGRNLDEALTPAVEQVRGTPVAFVAFLVSTDLGRSPQATVKNAGVSAIRGFEIAAADRLDREDLQRLVGTVRRLKDEGYLVIVSFHFHWGNFQMRFPDYVVDRGEEAVARGAIDAGADLVIGHGPHVLAPIEIYKGKPIVYSLGHFVFQLNPGKFLPNVGLLVERMKRHPRSKESMMFRCVIGLGYGVRAIELFPVAISNDGTPQVPDSKTADKILTSIEGLCSDRGSTVLRRANYATLDLTQSSWTKIPSKKDDIGLAAIFDAVSPTRKPIKALELTKGAFNRGSYSGVEKDEPKRAIEFRISGKGSGEIDAISGDITERVNSELVVTSFVCLNPEETNGGNTIKGGIVVRSPKVETGTFQLEMKFNGVGFVGVKTESMDRQLICPVVWRGQYLRRFNIEIDGFEAMPVPGKYESRTGQQVTLKSAFEDAGFDVNLEIDQFRGGPSSDAEIRGFSEAELVALLRQRITNRLDDGSLRSHLFIATFLAGGQRSTLGYMYSDSDRRGAAIFYHSLVFGDPRVSLFRRNRYFVMTAVHEIGHALNLPHCFSAERPAALSWMNYIHFYPYGAQVDNEIRNEFWRRFGETFDPHELRFLWHAGQSEIAVGKSEFLQFEAGLGLLMEEEIIRDKSLQVERDASFSIQPVKAEYDLGEPVFVELTVKNNGEKALRVPSRLSPAEGQVVITVRGPDQRLRTYRPPSSLCMINEPIEIAPGKPLPPVEGLPLFLSADGPTFQQPGSYEVQATLLGVGENGSKVALSKPAKIIIRVPDKPRGELADKLLSNRSALTALHFRHPLIARRAFSEAAEAVTKASTDGLLPDDNTTLACFDFVRAMGYSSPFMAPGSRREEQVKLASSYEILKNIKLDLPIPKSHKRRIAASRAEFEKNPASPTVFHQLITDPERKMRMEISPAGVFRTAGLDRLNDPDDTSRFIDAVSWDLSGLAQEGDKVDSIRRSIAEAIRAFRCDLWGIVCDNVEWLTQLVQDVNAERDTQYDKIAMPVNGKINAAIFRTGLAELAPIVRPNSDAERRLSDAGILLREVRLKMTDRSRVMDVCCAIVNFQRDGRFADEEFEQFIALLNDVRKEIASDLIVIGDIPFEVAAAAISDFDALSSLRFSTVSHTDPRSKQRTVIRMSSVELVHVVTARDMICEGTFDQHQILMANSDVATWLDPRISVPLPVRMVV